MKRWLSLSLFVSVVAGSAQISPPAPSDAQLLAGARTFFGTYLAAHQAKDAGRVAALYHDAARIIVTRQSAANGSRTLEFSGVQYKKLLLSVPLTEAPDRYLNPAYRVLGDGAVQITSQRQSMSRGYTAPHVLFLRADAAGRFWIMAEQAIQKVP
ncbi:hypothetical protein [Deinococcus aquaedulcis]|uniref:hypothetical protein n=1 Tax=Deinococcus aquaedulcis TaxID=2840455 RepID=UPI001C82BF42|nr:hypothetical protein [Deinococcus aquaedulcis]